MSTATTARVVGDAASKDTRRRRFGLWVAVAVVAVLFAVLTAVARGTDGGTPRPLDPTSTTASGSAALVRVLEQRGTTVTVTDRAADVDGGTVFVEDSDGLLGAGAAARIARSARHVVVVTTDEAALQAFGFDVTGSAPVDGDETVATTTCAIPEAAAAGRVSTGGYGWAVDDPTAERCAPTGTGDDRVWGLVRTAGPGGDVTLLGTTAALRNDTVTTAGNAALALALLGSDDHLTWYTPVAGSPDAAPTLGELAPPWVPGALALLGLVAVAAAVWRGRRLGPLVVEQMPVVVRAAETTEGRARMYAGARDRTHALDTLRVAAVRRLGRALGLPRSAHVDEVVRAVARATGTPPARVGAVLVGGPTTDDRGLVAGTAALDALEDAVRRATSGDVRRAASATGAGAPLDGRVPATTDDHRDRTGPTDHDRPGARP